MRVAYLVSFLVFFSGCVQLACMECDDGNPCTADACVEGECVHKPLTGPVEGCFSSGSCIEYTCFSGECIPQKTVECCGNGLCDPSESYSSCPRDCRPTCFDGIQNQGEFGVDCGGPCEKCVSEDMGYLRKIGFLRGFWYESATNYTDSVRSYNLGKDSVALMQAALQSYRDADNIRGRVLETKPPVKYALLRTQLNETLMLYMSAMHNMVLYLKMGDDRYRLESNRLLSDSLNSDKMFVREYNRLVDEFNAVQSRCFNFLRDEGEESVDCGGACSTPCEAFYNVTKHVTVRSEGGAARITLNISSPALNYPPQQSVVGRIFNPKPDRRQTTEEGNVYYIYEIDMPPFGVREFRVTETVRMYRMPFPVKSETEYFSSVYLLGNDFSPTSDDICFRAKMLKEEAKNTSQLARKIHDWLTANVKYEINHKELGAEYCYTHRKGACDEHADLFVSMARCVGTPARRVTGSLVNSSQLNGHAWSEYYDGGWVYVDPSVKYRDQAWVTDNKHIVACVGEGAYHCGVGYSYIYTGRKPNITVEEQTYLS